MFRLIDNAMNATDYIGAFALGWLLGSDASWAVVFSYLVGRCIGIRLVLRKERQWQRELNKFRVSTE